MSYEIANSSITVSRVGLSLVGVCMAVLVGLGGYLFGYDRGADYLQQNPGELVDSFRQGWEQERQDLAKIKRRARNDVDALALHMGDVQARMIRLDALGERLARIAKLDVAEFDFDQDPARGGPDASEHTQVSTSVSDFLDSLDQVTQELENREDQLQALEALLINRSLSESARPTGRPIEKGWISSFFGKRTDPFTGKKAFHSGMDFAGKAGTPIIAVAPGVVTQSKTVAGYGRMVEISHGGGYVTRYAHSRTNTVSVGDRVDKGQLIALMGSSGRSTGPHVHFEVLRNGQKINPANFLKD